METKQQHHHCQTVWHARKGQQHCKLEPKQPQHACAEKDSLCRITNACCVKLDFSATEQTKTNVHCTTMDFPRHSQEQRVAVTAFANQDFMELHGITAVCAQNVLLVLSALELYRTLLQPSIHAHISQHHYPGLHL
jgi:hypothetical protein